VVRPVNAEPSPKKPREEVAPAVISIGPVKL